MLQVWLLSPEQPNTASRMVEQRADAAWSQKKKSQVPALDVLATPTQQRVNVETWSRTLLYLNAVHRAQVDFSHFWYI